MSRPRTNDKNDRIKRDHLIWLKEAKQRAATTVDRTRHAIDRFEAYIKYKDFGTFNKEQAMGFKKFLLAQNAKRSGEPMSISTIHHILQAIQEFLRWLHEQPGHNRRIRLTDIDYLNLTTGQERQAHVTPPKAYATVEQYRTVLAAMPNTTEVECRDRALLALMLLTCMRDAAVISLKLKHISLEHRRVFQDPRQVKTKFSKTITTVFYPVGEDIVDIIREWVDFLTVEKKFSPNDPLFPKTVMKIDAGGDFSVQNLSREHWANATPIRKLFKAAFARVGLPYFNPHTMRDTLTHLAYQSKLNAAQFKAWSLNMGHDKPLTTFNSYGNLSLDEVSEIMSDLRQAQQKPAVPDDLAVKITEIHAMLKARS